MGRTLARGDALMIGAFAVLGLMAHKEPVSLAGILRNTAPIWITWFLLAPFLRTYTRPGWRNLLLNWVLAVPAGVWLRFMVLGRPFDSGFLVFLSVTLTVTLALLVAWRALAFRRLARA